MSLLSRLNDDMKTAMKAKDKESLQVIRMIKSSIQNEQIKEGHDLTEEEELTVLSREMKQRRDSLHEFEEAGRDDLAEKVKSEIVIVEKIHAGTTFRRRNSTTCSRSNHANWCFINERIWQSHGCDHA